MKCRFLLTTVVLAVLTVPAPAGIFGKKKEPPKPDPKDRVPELIAIVKTDKDESKRTEAAEELRQYDPKAFTDIIPVLIDVLMHDAKPAVRAEAAQSLGKIRPISMEAGWALEQAVAKDSAMRVRLQARSSLLQYHWAGYRSPGKDGPPLIESKEPPLAPPAGRGPVVAPTPGPLPRITPLPASAPPSPWGNRPTPYTPPPDARPLPTGPPLVPTEPPVLQPTPAAPSGTGPVLEPQ